MRFWLTSLEMVGARLLPFCIGGGRGGGAGVGGEGILDPEKIQYNTLYK